MNLLLKILLKKKNSSTFNDKYMIQLNTFSNSNEDLLIEINKTIDWTVLYNTLNMKWMEFDYLVLKYIVSHL